METRKVEFFWRYYSKLKDASLAFQQARTLIQAIADKTREDFEKDGWTKEAEELISVDAYEAHGGTISYKASYKRGETPKDDGNVVPAGSGADGPSFDESEAGDNGIGAWADDGGAGEHIPEEVVPAGFVGRTPTFLSRIGSGPEPVEGRSHREDGIPGPKTD